jgi:hypothetical protein
LVELQAFLDGTMTVDFAVAAEARYDFIARTEDSAATARTPPGGGVSLR